MMSGSRQRVTGRAIQNFLIWMMGFAVLWWLPIIMVNSWSGFLVASKEPWLLNTSDLTWQRIVLNLATKPGFRAVWVMLWSCGWVIAVWLPQSSSKRTMGKTWKNKLATVTFRSSMEWVMDGKRASALKEYAKLVRVL